MAKTFSQYFTEKSHSERALLTISWILKFTFLITMLSGLFTENYIITLRGILPMVVVLAPFILDSRYDIVTPAFLDLAITLSFFLHQAGVLYGIYTIMPRFDMFTHLFSSTILAMSIMVILYLVENNLESFRFGPGIMALLVVTFTVTFGVVWEMGEATVDLLGLLDTPAQESLADTMQDLSFDMLGSIIVAIAGYRAMKKGSFQRALSRTDEGVKRLVKSYSGRDA